MFTSNHFYHRHALRPAHQPLSALTVSKRTNQFSVSAETLNPTMRIAG